MGGITPAELAAIGDRLEGFAADVFESLPRRDQRGRGECYLRGLLLDGRRKSIQPMAARLGEVHYQALHHFVASSPWDWRPVRRRLAEVLTGALSPTAWVVDDTGFPKDGPCSVGVGRQYCGTLGKRANCQLVVDMLDELAGWGLVPPVLVADCGYGEVGEFRWGLEGRQIDYVVEVRSDTSAYPEQARPTAAPSKGRGRRPRPRYHHQPASLAELAMAAGQQAWVELVWRRGSRGLQRGRFLALRVRPAGVTPRRLARQAGGELPVCWLLAEWPKGKPEPTKYWLANLPETTPIVELVRLARSRWRVEQDDRECKGALGLDHFEGRSWAGWHHHVTLVSAAHGFLTLERLRHPKPAASA